MQINTNPQNTGLNINKQSTANQPEKQAAEPQTTQTPSAETPSGDLLKAYTGIKNITPKHNDEPQTAEQKEAPAEEMSAYDYLLTLPNVNATFKKELGEVAKVMERMDVESSNVEMMVNLVADGKLWRGVLRYFCENGKMTKPMEQDLDLLYESYADGVNPTDRYVPTVQDRESGIAAVKVGDTFEVDGEKNIYVKESETEAHQLGVSKELFAELFPPAERFACVQGAAGDCYLLSTLNSMMENPSQRHILYDMFEEKGDTVEVSMPDGEAVYSVPKDNLRQGIDKWQHLQGATGLILAEHVYGEELRSKFEKSFHETMNAEIERLEQEEPENTDKIEGYRQRVADFDRLNADGETLPVLRRFENPEANGKLTFQCDDNGIMFTDLKTANKECRRKLTTQADFYRGAIGGDLDVVMRDFGYDQIEEFKTANPTEEQAIKDILFSEDAGEKYIFTAGALSDGTLTEKPIAKDYSVYGCHAYKIAPFQDKNGETRFLVENPWNATQNSTMDYEKLKEYFEVICAVKVQ